MRCNEHRAKFTQRYDGELSAESLRELETHIQSCAVCETEWTNYLQAVQALKATGVSSLPDDYVDGILAATLGNQEQQFANSVIPGPTTSSPRGAARPAWSHVGAALAGAALMLLLVRIVPKSWLSGEQSQASSPELTQDLAQAVPIATDFNEPSANSNPKEPVAEAPAQETVHRPEPRIQYVNRAVFLPIPVPIPTKSTTPPLRMRSTRPMKQVLASASSAFLRLGQALEENTELLITQAMQREAADTLIEQQVLPVEVRHEPTLVASAIPPRRVDRGPSTLAIQRSEDRVSLSTNGTLDEVVPALIERLADEDPVIGELVQIRLQEIWSAHTGDAFLESPLSSEEQELDIQDIGWRKFVRRKEPADELPSPTEQWTTWWSNQQVSLASATF